MARNIATMGSVINTDAAITAPQSVLNSVENSESPIGRVLARLSVARQSAKMNSFQVVTKA